MYMIVPLSSNTRRKIKGKNGERDGEMAMGEKR